MLLSISIAVDEPVLSGVEGRTLWNEMLDALDAVSPLVDDARFGLAFLDMHGIAGSPRTQIAKAHETLAHFECTTCIGAGSNKIAAYAAGCVGDGTIYDPGTERALLAPLPLALLEIEPETIDRLRLLGIERLRDLARLPHGPFVRRFGSVAASWHELACGIDRGPFVPRAQAIAIEASIFGEGHASDEAQVFFALRMLLARICADLERCGKRAGRLKFSVELEDAGDCDFEVPLATPTAHERALFEMLRAKLEGASFNAAIVGLRLQALELEEGGEAQTLFCADDLDPQRVAVTLARLEAALGGGVVHAKTRDAHLLEERFSYEPFKLPRGTALSTCHPKHGDLVPQLRLLAVREVPVQLRGGEPAMVDRQAVRQCTGPWRIAERVAANGELASSEGRDEYDVVLEDGTFARIYHQGAHWYLRGVYE